MAIESLTQSFEEIRDDNSVVIDYQNVKVAGWASTPVRDSDKEVLDRDYWLHTPNLFENFMQNPVMDIVHKASPSNPLGQDIRAVCGQWTFIEWREPQGLWVEGMLSNSPEWSWLRWQVVEKNIRMLSIGDEWVKIGGRKYCTKLNEIAIVPIGSNPLAFMAPSLKAYQFSIPDFVNLLPQIEKLSDESQQVRLIEEYGIALKSKKEKKEMGKAAEDLAKLHGKLAEARKAGKVPLELKENCKNALKDCKDEAKKEAADEEELEKLMAEMQLALHDEGGEDGEGVKDDAKKESGAKKEAEAEDKKEACDKEAEAGASKKMAEGEENAEKKEEKADEKEKDAVETEDKKEAVGTSDKSAKGIDAQIAAGAAAAHVRGYSLKTKQVKGYHSKALADWIEKNVMTRAIGGEFEVGMDHSEKEFAELAEVGRSLKEKQLIEGLPSGLNVAMIEKGVHNKAALTGLGDTTGGPFQPIQTTTDYFLQLYLESQVARNCRVITMTSNEVISPSLITKGATTGLPNMGYGTPRAVTTYPNKIFARPIGSWQELSDSFLRDAVADPMAAVQQVTMLGIEQAAESMILNGQNLINSSTENATGGSHMDGSLWGTAGTLAQPDTGTVPPEFYADGIRYFALVTNSFGSDIAALLSAHAGDTNYDTDSAIMEVVGGMDKYAVNPKNVLIVLDPAMYNHARTRATFTKAYAASTLWTLNGNKLETLAGWDVVPSEVMRGPSNELFASTGLYDANPSNDLYHNIIAFYKPWACFGMRDSVVFQVVQNQYNFSTILKARMRCGFGVSDVTTGRPYAVAGINASI